VLFRSDYSPLHLPFGALLVQKALVQGVTPPPVRWRVPYVIVSGASRTQINRLVRSPEELHRRDNEAIRINTKYYIEKALLPALQRLLGCAGADIFKWYKNMHRPKQLYRQLKYDDDPNSMTLNKPKGQQDITQHLIMPCEICGQESKHKSNLFEDHHESCQMSLNLLFLQFSGLQQLDLELERNCYRCSRIPQKASLGKIDSKDNSRCMVGKDCCTSLDCPTFHDRLRVVLRLEDAKRAVQNAEKILPPSLR